jgi:hypothetical protein
VLKTPKISSSLVEALLPATLEFSIPAVAPSLM